MTRARSRPDLAAARAAVRGAHRRARTSVLGPARLPRRPPRMGSGAGASCGRAFPTASVIKVGIACAALDLVRRRLARLDDQLVLPPRAERVAGGGVLKQLELDRLSLRDAIELMITVSDNAATNAVFERCGGTERGERLPRAARASPRRECSASSTSRESRTTSRAAWACRRRASRRRCSQRLREGEILTPSSAHTCAACSSASTSRISCRAGSAGIPTRSTTAASRPLRVGSKSGELDGIRADVAIVRARGKGTLVLAVFTDGARDLRETVDVEGALAVAECSAAICAGSSASTLSGAA